MPMTAWVVTDEPHSPLTASWLIALGGMLYFLASAVLDVRGP